MRVEVIEDLDELKQLRSNWDAVYAADPEAQFYLTLPWLLTWLDTSHTAWFVLGVRPDDGSDYVAFLPMRMRTKFRKGRGFYHELLFMGDQFSDYNSVLCRPEHEAAALPLLAQYIKTELNWAELHLDNFKVSEKRRRLLLDPFDKLKFPRRDVSNYTKEDDVDQDICPYIDLPDDFEAYLATMSANNRQKARRMLRKVEEPGAECRITVSGPETYERDLGALLDLWRDKWRTRKGERTEPIVERNHKMLLAAAVEGNLFMPVFWHGDRIIAVLATLIDREKNSLHFVITGRDETFNDIPPGFVLHAFSIRHAIAEGFKLYDFLRGDEPYKFLFARQQHVIHTTILSTQSKRNTRGKPDLRSVPVMLHEAQELAKKQDTDSTELALRQILEIAPDNALALHRMGGLVAGRGDYANARDFYRRAVEIEPGGDNSWAGLAAALEELGDLSGALEAARKALELIPENQKAVNLVWRLGQAVEAAKPKPPTAQKAPAMALIAAAAAKKAGVISAGLDMGTLLNLDVNNLKKPGGDLKLRP
jgi:CelD/BcsL family acetyltransferase involved in cellulose biosynthesis